MLILIPSNSSTRTDANPSRTITPYERRNVVVHAKIVSAKICLAALVRAYHAFHDKYQILPGSDSSAIDAGEISNNPSMASLIDLLVAVDDNSGFQTFSNTKVPVI